MNFTSFMFLFPISEMSSKRDPLSLARLYDEFLTEAPAKALSWPLSEALTSYVLFRYSL